MTASLVTSVASAFAPPTLGKWSVCRGPLLDGLYGDLVPFSQTTISLVTLSFVFLSPPPTPLLLASVLDAINFNLLPSALQSSLLANVYGKGPPKGI